MNYADMKISQLKDLCQTGGIDMKGMAEKSDFIHALEKRHRQPEANKTDPATTTSNYEEMNVSELRSLCQYRGIDTSKMSEKREMTEALLIRNAGNGASANKSKAPATARPFPGRRFSTNPPRMTPAAMKTSPNKNMDAASPGLRRAATVQATDSRKTTLPVAKLTPKEPPFTKPYPPINASPGHASAPARSTGSTENILKKSPPTFNKPIASTSTRNDSNESPCGIPVALKPAWSRRQSTTSSTPTNTAPVLSGLRRAATVEPPGSNKSFLPTAAPTTKVAPAILQNTPARNATSPIPTPAPARSLGSVDNISKRTPPSFNRPMASNCNMNPTGIPVKPTWSKRHSTTNGTPSYTGPAPSGFRRASTVEATGSNKTNQPLVALACKEPAAIVSNNLAKKADKVPASAPVRSLGSTEYSPRVTPPSFNKPMASNCNINPTGIPVKPTWSKRHSTTKGKPTYTAPAPSGFRRASTVEATGSNKSNQHLVALACKEPVATVSNNLAKTDDKVPASAPVRSLGSTEYKPRMTPPTFNKPMASNCNVNPTGFHVEPAWSKRHSTTNSTPSYTASAPSGLRRAATIEATGSNNTNRPLAALACREPAATVSNNLAKKAVPASASERSVRSIEANIRMTPPSPDRPISSTWNGSPRGVPIAPKSTWSKRQSTTDSTLCITDPPTSGLRRVATVQSTGSTKTTLPSAALATQEPPSTMYNTARKAGRFPCSARSAGGKDDTNRDLACVRMTAQGPVTTVTNCTNRPVQLNNPFRKEEQDPITAPTYEITARDQDPPSPAIQKPLCTTVSTSNKPVVFRSLDPIVANVERKNQPPQSETQPSKVPTSPQSTPHAAATRGSPTSLPASSDDRSVISECSVTKRNSTNYSATDVEAEYQHAPAHKWVTTTHQFGGMLGFQTIGEQEEVRKKPILKAIEEFNANPAKYIALMYQTSMKTRQPKDQAYTWVMRKGTTNLEVKGISTDPKQGWMTIMIHTYQQLPPFPNNRLPQKDNYTEKMTHKGRKLPPPLLPGRGMGVADLPSLKIIGDIDPSDISQGQVGNCWLLSAISAIAEFDGAIKRLFRKTTHIDEMPRDSPNFYTISLYDLETWKEVDIVIDESLCASPDKANQLLASKPSEDGELWVPYLEKALAIHCGGWDEITGGQCTHAWAILTGCKHQYTIMKNPTTGKFICVAKCKGGEWAPHYNSPKKGIGSASWQVPWPEVGGGGAADLEITQDQLYQKMCAWDQENYIVGAGTKGLTDRHQTGGMVDNHAYSVLDCFPVVAGTKIDLMKVRNPWGKGEIEDGQFDDDGPGWDRYPQIKAELKPVVADDGIFFLTKEEFFEFFDHLYLSASNMTAYKED